MQLVFVENDVLIDIGIIGYGVARHYLAKLSRQTSLTEIIHNTKKPKQLNLTLVQIAFYAIWPGNGLGLFYNNSARDPRGLLVMLNILSAQKTTVSRVNNLVDQTWVGPGFHVDVSLLLGRIDDRQISVKLSTALSCHSPSCPLSSQSVAAVQLGAVLEPFRTRRPLRHGL